MNATTTCTNLVERRSGSSAKTGAGERAGAHLVMCNRPVGDDGQHCNRCATNLRKSAERTHSRYHDMLRGMAYREGRLTADYQPAADCVKCRKEATK